MLSMARPAPDTVDGVMIVGALSFMGYAAGSALYMAAGAVMSLF